VAGKLETATEVGKFATDTLPDTGIPVEVAVTHKGFETLLVTVAVKEPDTGIVCVVMM